jgi:hypothetical protein
MEFVQACGFVLKYNQKYVTIINKSVRDFSSYLPYHTNKMIPKLYIWTTTLIG